jgi:hypothetical protein
MFCLVKWESEKLKNSDIARAEIVGNEYVNSAYSESESPNPGSWYTQIPVSFAALLPYTKPTSG